MRREKEEKIEKTIIIFLTVAILLIFTSFFLHHEINNVKLVFQEKNDEIEMVLYEISDRTVIAYWKNIDPSVLKSFFPPNIEAFTIGEENPPIILNYELWQKYHYYSEALRYLLLVILILVFSSLVLLGKLITSPLR